MNLERFELALFILLAKGTLCKTGHHEQGSSNSDVVTSTYSDLSKEKGNHLVDGCPEDMLEPEGFRKLKDEVESHYTAHNILVELVDCVVDSHSDVANCKQQVQKSACSQSNLESRYQSNTERTSASNKVYADEVSTSCSYLNMPIGVGMNGSMDNGVIMEGPSDEDSSYQLNNCWPPDDQMQCMSMNSSCNMLIPNEWGRCNMQPLSWGGRIVGRSEVKTCLKRQCGVSREDYDAFVNIFEGGSLLYCNMSFEALLNVRKRLEEIGFPCKAVNDGLWLQVRN